MTPEEIQALITSLIIDNNTNQVTPAKLREVLFAINNAIKISDPASVTAVSPLILDAFTNVFSIQQASLMTSGFLSASDYALFKNSAKISHIFDGKIGVTAGFEVGQQDFELPVSAIVELVYFVNYPQYEETSNNAYLPNLYSIEGNILTLKTETEMNNYLYIKYKL